MLSYQHANRSTFASTWGGRGKLIGIEILEASAFLQLSRLEWLGFRAAHWLAHGHATYLKAKEVRVKLPERFRDAIDRDPGNCILVVGAGLSKKGVRRGGGGIPDWNQMMRLMISRLEGSGRLPLTKLQELNAMLEENPPRYLDVAEEFSLAHRSDRDGYEKFLRLHLNPNDLVESSLHKAILDTGFWGIVSYNFDMVFERQSGALERLVYPGLMDQIGRFQTKRFFAKLHGCISGPANDLVLTRSSYERLRQNVHYGELVRAIFFSHKVLCVGFKLEDPDFKSILADLKDFWGPKLPPLYALMRDPGREVQDRWLEQGIDILGYEEHSEIEDFFKRLSRLREQKKIFGYQANAYEEYTARGSNASDLERLLTDPASMYIDQGCADLHDGYLSNTALEHVESKIHDGKGQLVLSNFGEGKSYLSLQLFSRQATRFQQDSSERIPVYYPLSRGIPDIAGLHEFLAGKGFPQGVGQLANFIAERRLFIIFDGLDEIPSLIDLQATETLQRLTTVAGPCPWVVTSRLGLFLPIFDRVQGGLQEHCSITTLLAWDLGKWRKYLEQCERLGVFTPDPDLDPENTSSGQQMEQFAARVLQDETRQLVTTPLFARMLASTWRNIRDSDGPFEQRRLYQRYSDDVLERRERDIPLADKHACMEAMALYLFRTNKGNCSQQDLEPVAAQHIKNASLHGIRRIVALLQTYSLLIVDPDGTLRFSHKTFHDYFLACALADSIKKRGWQIKELTHLPIEATTATFLVQLLPDRCQDTGPLLRTAAGLNDILRKNLLLVAIALRVSLADANLRGLELTGLNFDNCSLPQASLDRVVAWSASFRNADLSGASLLNSQWHLCDFSGANLRGAKLQNASFDRCRGLDEKGLEDSV